MRRSLPRVEAQQAVAEIHMGLAGRREIMRGQLAEPAASPHHQPGLAHDDQMFHGAVVAASARRRQFADRARVAVGQFAQHLPAGIVAEDKNELFLIRQRGRGGRFRGFGVGIHARSLEKRRTKRKCGYTIQKYLRTNQFIG
jgi:hypothetical protein